MAESSLQEKLAYDPLDATKVWPEEDYPYIEVGKMTLNENPRNWFSQNEQLAFSPSNVVPGACCDSYVLCTAVLLVPISQLNLCSTSLCGPGQPVPDFLVQYVPVFPRVGTACTCTWTACLRSHEMVKSLSSCYLFFMTPRPCIEHSNGSAGITFSDDKLLQSRLFSYADAQRYRLGVNYTELPVNVPKCPFHANQNEGAMQMNAVRFPLPQQYHGVLMEQ